MHGALHAESMTSMIFKSTFTSSSRRFKRSRIRDISPSFCGMFSGDKRGVTDRSSCLSKSCIDLPWRGVEPFVFDKDAAIPPFEKPDTFFRLLSKVLRRCSHDWTSFFFVAIVFTKFRVTKGDVYGDGNVPFEPIEENNGDLDVFEMFGLARAFCTGENLPEGYQEAPRRARGNLQ